METVAGSANGVPIRSPYSASPIRSPYGASPIRSPYGASSIRSPYNARGARVKPAPAPPRENFVDAYDLVNVFNGLVEIQEAGKRSIDGKDDAARTLEYMSNLLNVADRLRQKFNAATKTDDVLDCVMPLVRLDIRHARARQIVESLLSDMRDDMDSPHFDVILLNAYSRALELADPGVLNDVDLREDIRALTAKLELLNEDADVQKRLSLVTALGRAVDVFYSNNRRLQHVSSGAESSPDKQGGKSKAPEGKVLTKSERTAAQGGLDRFLRDPNIHVAYAAWNGQQQLKRTPDDESSTALLLRVAIHVATAAKSVASLVTSYGSDFGAYGDLYSSVKELLNMAADKHKDSDWPRWSELQSQVETMFSSVRLFDSQLEDGRNVNHTASFKKVHDIFLHIMSILSALRTADRHDQEWRLIYGVLRGIRLAALEDNVECSGRTSEFLCKLLGELFEVIDKIAERSKKGGRAHDLIRMWVDTLVQIVRRGDEESQQRARQQLTQARLSLADNAEADRAVFNRVLAELAGTDAIDLITQLPSNRSRRAEIAEHRRLVTAIFDNAYREVWPQHAIVADMSRDQMRRLSDPAGRGSELALYVEPSLTLSKTHGANQFVDGVTEVSRTIEAQLALPKAIRQIILLLGEAGVGKSLLLDRLFKTRLEQYRTGDPIPLLLALPSVAEPTRAALPQLLSKYGCTSTRAEEFKKRPIVLFVDGYDEIQCSKNLFWTNEWSEWDVVVVIATRLEYIEGLPGWAALFRGGTSAAPGAYAKDLYLRRFTAAKRNTFWENVFDYRTDAVPALGSRVEGGSLAALLAAVPLGGAASATEFASNMEAQVKNISGLEELMEVPFIIVIVTIVLPQLIERSGGNKLRRAELYSAFINFWHDQMANRLLSSGEAMPARFDAKTSFAEYGRDFAFEMLRRGQQSVISQLGSYTMETEESKVWARFFDVLRPTVTIAMRGVPLRTDGNRLSFLHKSIQEYYAAEVIFNAIGDAGQRRSLPAGSPLLVGAASNEPSILRFVADMLSARSDLHESLWSIIFQSRRDWSIAPAAALAVTLFNLIFPNKCVFAGVDLSNVCIPGADLTGAVLIGTNFTGANLEGVRLAGCLMANANFENANMKDVYVGVYARTRNKTAADVSFVINPTTNTLSTISVGEMFIERSVQTLQAVEEISLAGHSARTVAADAKGEHVAIGMFKKMALMSRNSESQQWEMTILPNDANNTRVNFAWFRPIFSPNSDYIAGVSREGNILIWSVKTKRLLHSLAKPRGDEFLGASFTMSDKTGALLLYSVTSTMKALFWSVESGQALEASAVAYAACDRKADDLVNLSGGIATRDGRRLACRYYISGGIFPMVVWTMTAGNKFDVAHSRVFPRCDKMQFSGDGKWIATALNSHISLFEVETGAIIQEFDGHVGSISSLDFSPDNGMLVSIGVEDSIRLWDTDTASARGHAYQGHEQIVADAVFSPDGTQILSLSDGGVVRSVAVWNADSGLMEKRMRVKVDRLLCWHKRDTALMASDLGVLIVNVKSGKVEQTVRLKEVARMISKDASLSFDGFSSSIAASADARLIVFHAENQKKNIEGIFIYDLVSGTGSYSKLDPPNVTILADDYPGSALCMSPSGHKVSTVIRYIYNRPDSADENSGPAPPDDFSVIHLMSLSYDSVFRCRPFAVPSHVRRAIFSPNESLLATLDDLRVVRVHRFGNWDQVAEIAATEQDTWPISAAFSADSKRLICNDGALVRIFDIARPAGQNQVLLKTLRGHSNGISALAMAPRGDHVVTTGHDGYIFRWHVIVKSGVVLSSRAAVAIAKRRIFYARQCVGEGIKGASDHLFRLLVDHAQDGIADEGEAATAAAKVTMAAQVEEGSADSDSLIVANAKIRLLEKNLDGIKLMLEQLIKATPSANGNMDEIFL